MKQMNVGATAHTQNQAKSMAESVLESPKVGIPLQGQMLPDLQSLKLEGDKRNGAETKSTGELEKKGDCIIFVGDISRTTKNQDLRAVMEKHGTVVNVDIKRDRVTNNNLGYGFVTFATREQAIAAKKNLHGADVCGKKIRIGWAQRNTTLFVGDLDNYVDKGVYKSAFARYGPLVDEETYFKVDKGFGMVKFKTRENAETAKMELSGKKIGNSKRPVRVIWADTSVQKHCVHVKFDVKETKTLQEGDITEELLQKVFNEYGRVVTVNLPRRNDATLKGYGFVHFEDTEKGEESAKKAIAGLSGTKIGRFVVQCNYGRKHSKRKARTNTNAGGSNNSNVRHQNQMYMYPYGPQSGTYPPTMMYPVQNPYMYQQQVARRGGPTHSPMYPPAYGYQQMGFYAQYNQGHRGSGTSAPPSEEIQNNVGVEYGMNMNPDRSYDSRLHMNAMHGHDQMQGRLHQR